MNIERLKTLRAHMQDVLMHEDPLVPGYDQSEWCGTNACLAGHAVWLFARETYDEAAEIKEDGIMQEGDALDSIDLTAAELLGLDRDQRIELFGWVNPLQARYNVLSTLDGLIETGKVDWGINQ